MNIWPWSTLRDNKLRIAYLERQERQERFRYDQLERAKVEARRDRGALLAVIDDYEVLLKQAHFRSPDTGRLMAKGKLPERKPR